MLISDEYRKLNEELHKKNPTWGVSNSIDFNYIQALLTNEVESVLDYGCGKGRLGKIITGGKVQSYDPCVPEFSAPPQPADLVVCSAVLEHVEPECLDAVLDDLKRLALKFIYLKVDTKKSSYTLKDGRNAHLIQKDFEWWFPQLYVRWKIRQVEVGERKFIFIGRT